MIEMEELKIDLKDTYESTHELIEIRMREAWRYDEVVSLFKETIRQAQVAIIKRILKEHAHVEKEREKLERMKKRLETSYEDLNETKEEWNERTFIAVSKGIDD